jgi:hypothetical protein
MVEQMAVKLIGLNEPEVYGENFRFHLQPVRNIISLKSYFIKHHYSFHGGVEFNSHL